jgi:hypothetical protein
MSKWLLRGLVMAVLMLVCRMVHWSLVLQAGGRTVALNIAAMLIFGLIALAWGLIDGLADARANPDPDLREDLAMRWIWAGMIAGVVSGVLVSIVAAFFWKQLYTARLFDELTTTAAFVLMGVFLNAIIGVSIGRWLVDRHAPEVASRVNYDEERADTDAFAAVKDQSAR